jgi:hypothetical protein
VCPEQQTLRPRPIHSSAASNGSTTTFRIIFHPAARCRTLAGSARYRPAPPLSARRPAPQADGDRRPHDPAPRGRGRSSTADRRGVKTSSPRVPQRAPRTVQPSHRAPYGRCFDQCRRSGPSRPLVIGVKVSRNLRQPITCSHTASYAGRYRNQPSSGPEAVRGGTV